MMKNTIFISHSSSDYEMAFEICELIEKHNVSCWIAPRDIAPGANYAEEIMDGISSSKGVLLLLTKNSNISSQVLREIERSVAKNIPILPLITDDVFPSKELEYFISPFQRLSVDWTQPEAYQAKIIKWVSNVSNKKIEYTIENFSFQEGDRFRENYIIIVISISHLRNNALNETEEYSLEDDISKKINNISREQGAVKISTFSSDTIIILHKNPTYAIRNALFVQQLIEQENLVLFKIGITQGEIFIKNKFSVNPSGRQIKKTISLKDLADKNQILLTGSLKECAKRITEIEGSKIEVVSYGNYLISESGAIDICEISNKEIRACKLPVMLEELRQSGSLQKAEFSGYRIVEKVGEGGMGVVYIADKILENEKNSIYAIKVLTPGLEDIKKFRHLFIKEAVTIQKLDHENIISILEINSDALYPYFVMEYIDGLPIDIALENSSLNEIIIIFIQICEALFYAHEHNVIHKDINPNNILITKNSKPILLDFGLSAFTASEKVGSSLTALVGSPQYMSPEMISEEIDIGVSSDIYSLGAVLYKVITKKTPFNGDTIYEVVASNLYDVPKLPKEINNEISNDIQNICLKALEKNKNNRYISINDMKYDLQSYLDGERINTRPSVLDNAVYDRANQHINEAKNWFSKGFISKQEFINISDSYNVLLQKGISTLLESRTISLSLLFIYIGGWMTLNGASLWLTSYWDELQSSSRLTIGLLPTVIGHSLFAFFWVMKSFKSAYVCLVIGILGLPFTTGVILYEQQWLEYSFYNKKYGEIFNVQLIAALLISFLWGHYCPVKKIPTPVA